MTREVNDTIAQTIFEEVFKYCKFLIKQSVVGLPSYWKILLQLYSCIGFHSLSLWLIVYKAVNSTQQTASCPNKFHIFVGSSYELYYKLCFAKVAEIKAFPKVKQKPWFDWVGEANVIPLTDLNGEKFVTIENTFGWMNLLHSLHQHQNSVVLESSGLYFPIAKYASCIVWTKLLPTTRNTYEFYSQLPELLSLCAFAASKLIKTVKWNKT